MHSSCRVASFASQLLPRFRGLSSGGLFREREKERERERGRDRQGERHREMWTHGSTQGCCTSASTFPFLTQGLRGVSLAMRRGQELAPAAPQAEQATAAKCGRDRGVTGLSLQLGGRCGPILDTLLRMLAGYRRAISKAAGKDGGRSLHKWKTFECIAGKVHRRDNPPCRRAQGLEREVVRTSLGCCFAPFENEPLLVNAGSMTET